MEPESLERGRGYRALVRDPRFYVPAVILGLMTLMAISPGAFGAGDPHECFLRRSLQGPSLEHPFGVDFQGCDYYTRVVYGARASIGIGVAVVVTAALIGLLVGGLAGFYGGVIDAVVGRLSDVLLAMPLVLTGAIILSFTESRGPEHVMMVLVLLGWPPMVRLVRGQVMSVRDLEHVQAARAIGAGSMRILIRHILPMALWPVLVYATGYVAVVITAEAILSFLGVGLDLPAISWGLMLGQVRHRVLVAPYLLIPAAFLSATVAAFAFMVEALRAWSDPQRVAQ